MLVWSQIIAIVVLSCAPSARSAAHAKKADSLLPVGLHAAAEALERSEGNPVAEKAPVVMQQSECNWPHSQCDGQNWPGPTCCTDGWVCAFLDSKREPWTPRFCVPPPAIPKTPTVSIVPGTSYLSRDGQRLIMNGMKCSQRASNLLLLAWINYGWDFNTTACVTSSEEWPCTPSVCGVHDAMQRVADSGGNAVRMWMFQSAMSDPTKQPFSIDESTGLVSGLREGVVERAKLYLDMAAAYGLTMIYVLWNGAYIESEEMLTCQIFSDGAQANAQRDAVITHVITPLAAALNGHPALAAWEVMNEPGGMIDFEVRDAASPCTDLTSVQSKGREDNGGWVSACLRPVTTIASSLNKQIAALKAAAPKHLVTGSSWSPSSISSAFGENLWADTCLVQAGGEPSGTIDVWQPHDYAKILPSYDGKPYGVGWPGTTPASAYKLDGPVLVGEISNTYQTGESWQNTSVAPYNETMTTLATQVINNGYAGLLPWQYSCEGAPKDPACIFPPEISESMKAAAAASKHARTLEPQGTVERPAHCAS